jgi:hypothetical protein
MAAITQPLNCGVRCLTQVTAIMLGLGALLPLFARERGRPSDEPPLTEDRSTGRIDPKERLRKNESRLFEQRKATVEAEGAYNRARQAREVAQIAAQQYIEWVFPQELAEADREIKLAVLNLWQTQRDLTRARENACRGFPLEGQTIYEESCADRATAVLEQARSKKKVLLDCTTVKRIRELNADFDKALANELRSMAAWEREKSKETALELRVVPWQVIAVIDGSTMRRPPSRFASGL